MLGWVVVSVRSLFFGCGGGIEVLNELQKKKEENFLFHFTSHTNQRKNKPNKNKKGEGRTKKEKRKKKKTERGFIIFLQ
jgi:hypothetical protein